MSKILGRGKGYGVGDHSITEFRINSNDKMIVKYPVILNALQSTHDPYDLIRGEK